MSSQLSFSNRLRWIAYRFRRRCRVRKACLSDARRYLKGSATLEQRMDRRQLEARITTAYHVIEKALSLPDIRDRFGEANTTMLLNWMRAYRNDGHPLDGTVYQAACCALETYVQHHQQHGEALGALGEEIFRVVSEADLHPKQEEALPFKRMLREPDGKSCETDYQKFVDSWHSTREFSGEEVPGTLIRKAVQMASRAPSSCNRQGWNVLLISDPDRRKQFCSLQQGNRGFGHCASSFLVITGDLRVFHGAHERNQAYVDGGIFSLALLHALHALGLGCCPLNWAATPERDSRLRETFDIHEGEVVVMCIAVGQLPETWTVARSLRRSPDEILREDRFS